MYFNPDRRYRGGGFWRCRVKTREHNRDYYERRGMDVRWRQLMQRHRSRLAELESRLATRQGGS